MGKWKKRGAEKGARRWSVKTLIKKHNGLCALCGVVCTFDINEDNQATVDHVVPISKGGLDVITNMQLLCRKCNTEKGDTVLDDG